MGPLSRGGVERRSCACRLPRRRGWSPLRLLLPYSRSRSRSTAGAPPAMATRRRRGLGGPRWPVPLSSPLLPPPPASPSSSPSPLSSCSKSGPRAAPTPSVPRRRPPLSLGPSSAGEEGQKNVPGGRPTMRRVERRRRCERRGRTARRGRRGRGARGFVPGALGFGRGLARRGVGHKRSSPPLFLFLPQTVCFLTRTHARTAHCAAGPTQLPGPGVIDQNPNPLREVRPTAGSLTES